MKKKGTFIFKCLKPLGLALLASLNNSPGIPPDILGPYSLFCQNIFSKEEIKLHFPKTINELKQFKDNIIHNKYRFLFLKSITFQIENVKEKENLARKRRRKIGLGGILIYWFASELVHVHVCGEISFSLNWRIRMLREINEKSILERIKEAWIN